MLRNVKPILSRLCFGSLAVAVHAVRPAIRRVQIALLNQRPMAIRAFADRERPPRGPRVLAVVEHVSSARLRGDAAAVQSGLLRLQGCLERLVASFAHCRLQIVVLTFEGMSLVDLLPEYLKSRVRVRTETAGDPSIVGFKAQDEFLAHQGEFDWFMMIEDDIRVHDSYMLEKLAAFNARMGNPKYVLLPNRFEVWEGRKTYVDLVAPDDGRDFAWNRLSAAEDGPVKFAECENPHAGVYCLNAAQLQRWQQSGRHWNGKVMFIGPLESVVTGCLFECFLPYRPHPRNLHYLEVEHFDTKYSKLIAAARPGAALAGR